MKTQTNDKVKRKAKTAKQKLSEARHRVTRARKELKEAQAADDSFGPMVLSVRKRISAARIELRQAEAIVVKRTAPPRVRTKRVPFTAEELKVYAEKRKRWRPITERKIPTV